ncbi:MAG: glutamate--tRNA ligase [Planctomycetota bacterium]|nr:glutamate--tRNA ligase [Planctomycetota bacterium]
MADPVVVRVAPSPTGDPHVGTAYTCLFNLALRRKRGGTLILRIDDTDRTRYRADSEEAIQRELRWLGLEWDAGPDVGGPCAPYRQSERTELYRRSTDELIRTGAAYRCDCTKQRLDEVRAAQRARKQQPRYDGHCRERNVPEKTPHVARLKVPETGETTFRDGLRGPITIAHCTVDDQVLLKSDGFPTYHLATVVDDHDMGVTHILRAEEWINSTPKHILIYKAFGWDLPEYYHLPLLRNPDRSKISKRKNPTSITWYRENGFLPEALVNFLALMGWSYGEDREEFTLLEFIEAFELTDIKTSGPVFDLQKLEWLNGVYIRKLEPAALVEAIKEVSALARDADPMVLAQVAPLTRERMKRLTEFDELADFFFNQFEPPAYEDLIPKKRTDTGTAAMLRLARQIIAESETLEPERLEAQLRELAEKGDWKPRELFMSLRWAVTAKKVTPPIIESICILGRAECIERIDASIDVLGDPENPILGTPSR